MILIFKFRILQILQQLHFYFKNMCHDFSFFFFFEFRIFKMIQNCTFEKTASFVMPTYIWNCFIVSKNNDYFRILMNYSNITKLTDNLAYNGFTYRSGYFIPSLIDHSLSVIIWSILLIKFIRNNRLFTFYMFNFEI